MKIFLLLRQVVRTTAAEIDNLNLTRLYNSLNVTTRTYLFLEVYVTTVYREMSYLDGGTGGRGGLVYVHILRMAITSAG
jgi:hypothetical protein